MKHLFFITSLIIGTTLLLACTEENAMESSKIQDQASNTFLIDYKISRLQISDAIKVAAQFTSTDSYQSRSMTSMPSGEITPVYSDDGTVVMYVVNYQNNLGYVVVGASKNYAPILAYSDTGNINDSILHNDPLICEYKKHIEEVISLSADSLRQAYAYAWLPYEDVSGLIPETRVGGEWSDDEVSALRAQAVQNYESQGYTCFPLSYALDLIPPTPTEPQRAQNFVNQMSAQTASGYNPLTVDIFATKTTETTYGPLIQTTWYQEPPFSGWARNKISGCFIITMAQMMYYHKHPNTYNWNLISPGTEGSSELDRLIRDLQTQAHADDSTHTDGTWVKLRDALSTMNNKGYDTDCYGYPNETQRTRLENSIINGFPAIMCGTDSVGHAWVCDGYRRITTYYSAGLFTRLGIYRLQTGLYEYQNFFHMNWGWASLSGGWYYEDNVNTIYGDYCNNRKIIFVTPN